MPRQPSCFYLKPDCLFRCADGITEFDSFDDARALVLEAIGGTCARQGIKKQSFVFPDNFLKLFALFGIFMRAMSRSRQLDTLILGDMMDALAPLDRPAAHVPQATNRAWQDVIELAEGETPELPARGECEGLTSNSQLCRPRSSRGNR